MQTSVHSARQTKKPSTLNKLRKKLERISIRQWSGIGLIALLVSLATWYGISQNQKTANATNKLQVMASFYPVYDLARQVGGEVAEVTNITPTGAEAHDFEPSPKTLTEAYQAGLFIYHDEEMEPWVSKFIKDYSGVAVRSIEGIDVHAVDEHEEDHEAESEEHHEEDDGHNHSFDPHVWTDPILAEKMVDNILAGFAAADPANRTIYEANAANLKSELARLDQEFSQQLTICSQRTIVTSHAAFHYFADRYNLTILPISGLTPTQEPSAGKLAELSNLVKDQGITTIFFESQTSPQLAQTLARETGAKTAILDPIEGINQSSSTESYVSIQEKNLVSLKTALACN